MTNRKISRLLALSDAEFGRKSPAPARQRFKALSVNVAKLSGDWDRQRGAAARMMAIVLREDSDGLLQKVGADHAAADTFADAVDWLGKEATYLRKLAARMDLAAGRLSSAVSRYREQITSARGDMSSAAACAAAAMLLLSPVVPTRSAMSVCNPPMGTPAIEVLRKCGEPTKRHAVRWPGTDIVHREWEYGGHTIVGLIDERVAYVLDLRSN